MKVIFKNLILMVMILYGNKVLSQSEGIGDWLFQETDEVCFAYTTSTDVQFEHYLYTVKNQNKMGAFVIFHWINGPYEDQFRKNMLNNIVFKFGSNSEVTLPSYYSLVEEKFKGKDFALAPIAEGVQGYHEIFLKNFKAENTYTIQSSNKEMFAGPFSLKGSSKLMKKLSSCK